MSSAVIAMFYTYMYRVSEDIHAMNVGSRAGPQFFPRARTCHHSKCPGPPPTEQHIQRITQTSRKPWLRFRKLNEQSHKPWQVRRQERAGLRQCCALTACQWKSTGWELLDTGGRVDRNGGATVVWVQRESKYILGGTNVASDAPSSHVILAMFCGPWVAFGRGGSLSRGWDASAR